MQTLPSNALSRPRRSFATRSLRTNLVVKASKQNVLVIGTGAREHSLAWKLAQSSSCGSLYVAPGNAGTQLELNMVTLPSLNPSDHKAIISFCKEKSIDLVVVGPEQPLVDGLVDTLDSAGISAFGPTAAAARLEGSKAFMKDLCKKYNIDTAGYGVFTDANKAKAFIKEHGAPIVVKASGLAAGKGVIVAFSLEEAYAAVDDMLLNYAFGSAGAEVVVEEFLKGEEASFFAFIDGETVIPLAGAQDHKAVGEGDVGPNTGGMGSYSPAPVLTPAMEAAVIRDIIYPTARGMAAEGCPFRGVLFAGLMIDGDNVKLLEHNVRFGDPECQSLMVRLETDLLDGLGQMLKGSHGGVGGSGRDLQFDWSSEASLTVVLAANGYPGAYRKDSTIEGLDNVEGAKVFHAGTALRESDGKVVSAGGRVLSVTATGKDVLEAQKKAYKGVDAISFPDGFCRRDIGWRAVDRMS